MRSQGSKWGLPWWADSSTASRARSQLCLGAGDTHGQHWVESPPHFASSGPGEPAVLLCQFPHSGLPLLLFTLGVPLIPMHPRMQLMAMPAPSISDADYQDPYLYTPDV